MVESPESFLLCPMKRLARTGARGDPIATPSI